MNPNDFPWSEDQQVTVKNPTDKPYKFKVHNRDYEVGAGKTMKMPGYMAWVFVYGLSTQLAQAKGEFNRWNEEDFRQTYYEQVYLHIDEQVQAVEEVETSPLEEVDDEDLDGEEEGADAPAEPEAPAQPEPAAPAPETTKPDPNAAKEVKPMQPKAKTAAAK